MSTRIKKKKLLKLQDEAIMEIQTLGSAELPNKLWPTKYICAVYGLSIFTLGNYRRGYYYTNDGTKTWFTENHDKLKHIPQGQPPLTDANGSVKYTIPWVNEFLRKLGKEQSIPAFLRHL